LIPNQHLRLVSTFAFTKAAQPSATSEDIQREIIDFDSQALEGMALSAPAMPTTP
jgi:hypothetical protein